MKMQRPEAIGQKETMGPIFSSPSLHGVGGRVTGNWSHPRAAQKDLAVTENQTENSPRSKPELLSEQKRRMGHW